MGADRGDKDLKTVCNRTIWFDTLNAYGVGGRRGGGQHDAYLFPGQINGRQDIMIAYTYACNNNQLRPPNPLNSSRGCCCSSQTSSSGSDTQYLRHVSS